jgi:hypothetical protein
MIILLMLWKFFLCTVKNNGRKFVNFALRKSIFFVHFDVLVETCWASQIFRFYAWKKKTLNFNEAQQVSNMNIRMNKKNDFLSATSNKFSAIIFHSVPQLLLQDSLNNFFARSFSNDSRFQIFFLCFFFIIFRDAQSLWSEVSFLLFQKFL